MAQILFSKFIVIVNLILAFSEGQKTDPLVTVKHGKLRGTTLRLLDGISYYSFKGIPYAHIPERFLAPVEPLSWQGIRDATKHGPVCPQFNLLINKLIEGDENCLFLNVYTKTINSDAKTPVMVFIHGGSFMFGSGNTDEAFGPEFLLQHDVILVTMNYRLEVLGFLNLDTPEVPGNAGLKDQAAALRWVKDNIAQFGGDPNNISLFGESSGSAAVAFHLQSPMSKGLFHKAIAQSGVSVVDWAQGKHGKMRAFRAARYLGNHTKDTKKVLEFLRSIPATKLTRLTLETMTEDEKNRDLPVHFAPVVEKEFNNVEGFITEDPMNALTAGRFSRVPLMLGYNSDEALLMLSDAFSKLNFTNKHLRYLVPREIAQKVPKIETRRLGEEIRNFYLDGNREFTKDDEKLISDMLSDRHFVYSTHRFANVYSKFSSSTYLYRFSCDSELNAVKKDIGYSHMKGASHADELFYIFYNDFNKDANKNPKLKDLIFRVTKLWTDFAKFGTPTPDDFFGIKWMPYTSSSRAFVDINENLTSGVNSYKTRVDFWNKMYCDAKVPCINE